MEQYSYQWLKGDILAPKEWTPPAGLEDSPFARRRLFFNHHPTHCNGHTTCPCCGYPTLEFRGAFDYCSICHWEDDGQDDPYADQDNGGPNGGWTLQQARRNFSVTLSMFAPNDDFFPKERVLGEAAQHKKKRLCRLYDSLMTVVSEDEIRRIWSEIDRQWGKVP
ncbi:hypothetical protein C2E25_04700 [Geothermobacter hydrogeniphilus]|uniref:Cysteine-rich CPCC domain-containing protein n=1 Tax=Geothermobacter hydrogeniphilus TaxID=1969733 RepID=A0A2K2HC51_9BACT|nr:CPCC family cysteine-rich protein [Geothermobacter hydrogeniphilus]PNU20894.1 hypothetical protein C2E25_04700 [Geothermobacter hydrogeniphilus]